MILVIPITILYSEQVYHGGNGRCETFLLQNAQKTCSAKKEASCTCQFKNIPKSVKLSITNRANTARKNKLLRNSVYIINDNSFLKYLNVIIFPLNQYYSLGWDYG